MRRSLIALSAFLFVAAIGSLIISLAPPSEGKTSLRHLQDGEEAEPFVPREGLLAAYNNRNSLSPELMNNMIFTWGNSQAEKDYKQAHFSKMVRYHAPMRPCLHKTFYGIVQRMNPWLYDPVGLTDEEKEMWNVNA